MKYIALATALALSGAAVAQTTPPPTTGSQDTMTQDTSPPITEDSSVPPPTNTPPSGVPATAGDPAGGYMPTQPALSAPATAGATVRFQTAPSPDQAYPAPPPMEEYPICEPGQTDGCRQRGG